MKLTASFATFLLASTVLALPVPDKVVQPPTYQQDTTKHSGDAPSKPSSDDQASNGETQSLRQLTSFQPEIRRPIVSVPAPGPGGIGDDGASPNLKRSGPSARLPGPRRLSQRGVIHGEVDHPSKPPKADWSDGTVPIGQCQGLPRSRCKPKSHSVDEPEPEILSPFMKPTQVVPSE